MTRHPTAEIVCTTVSSGFILTTASSFTAQAAVPFSGTLTAGSGILLQAIGINTLPQAAAPSQKVAAPFLRQPHLQTGIGTLPQATAPLQKVAVHLSSRRQQE